MSMRIFYAGDPVFHEEERFERGAAAWSAAWGL
jgi:hypothetical protein